MKNKRTITSNITLICNQNTIAHYPTFWDADWSTLDLVNDKNFIIARIAERGKDEEIDFILKFYSKSDILTAVDHFPEITSRTKNYFHVILR